MARHLRLEYAGAVYHVTARGNDRAAMFHTEQDRRHLLEVVASLLDRVSTLWGVSLARIHSRQRPNEVRDAAIYLCREVGAKPLGEIGAVLRIKGSAVSLAAKRTRQRSAADRGLRKRLEAAKNELITLSSHGLKK